MRRALSTAMLAVGMGLLTPGCGPKKAPETSGRVELPNALVEEITELRKKRILEDGGVERDIMLDEHYVQALDCILSGDPRCRFLKLVIEQVNGARETFAKAFKSNWNNENSWHFDRDGKLKEGRPDPEQMFEAALYELEEAAGLIIEVLTTDVVAQHSSQLLPFWKEDKDLACRQFMLEYTHASGATIEAKMKHALGMAGFRLDPNWGIK